MDHTRMGLYYGGSAVGVPFPPGGTSDDLAANYFRQLFELPPPDALVARAVLRRLRGW